jgi:polyhydroxybutyrate depolymerase
VSGGLERTYLLHVPPGYSGHDPLPLVINLHGFGSNATDQMRYSRFNPLADRENFIVVAPEGSGYPKRWTFPGLGDVDDVAFIGALIGELSAALCIDESRIYAAGISNGAAISTFVACGLPGQIAAISAVAATAGPRLCPDDVIVPIITFRGTDDACVPYKGGMSACGMALPVVAATEVMRLWGEHNGCANGPVEERIAGSVVRTAYLACRNGADALLYTVEGGGHTWPGSINVPRLGAVTQEIDATDLSWQFFERFSTP